MTICAIPSTLPLAVATIAGFTARPLLMIGLVPSTAVHAFQGRHTFTKIHSGTYPYVSTELSTTTTTTTLSTADAAKTNLVTVAERLRYENGVFLYGREVKSELQRAAEELEAVGGTTTKEEVFTSRFLGDWELVCTTATTNAAGVREIADEVSNRLFPLLKGNAPLQKIRRSLTENTSVLQRIRSTKKDNGLLIDRVDHIIEFQPFNSLSSLFDSVPDTLKNINVNPFEVSKAKLTLVHKATIQSMDPVIQTKLTLESVVLSVAGTSQYLDPSGADVLGINIPSLTDFLNAGTFDTTYMDDDLRISRGKLAGGTIEQLRVFTKKTSTMNTVTSTPPSVAEAASAPPPATEQEEISEPTIVGADVVPLTSTAEKEENETTGNSIESTPEKREDSAPTEIA